MPELHLKMIKEFCCCFCQLVIKKADKNSFNLLIDGWFWKILLLSTVSRQRPERKVVNIQVSRYIEFEPLVTSVLWFSSEKFDACVLEYVFRQCSKKHCTKFPIACGHMRKFRDAREIFLYSESKQQNSKFEFKMHTWNNHRIIAQFGLKGA